MSNVVENGLKIGASHPASRAFSYGIYVLKIRQKR